MKRARAPEEQVKIKKREDARWTARAGGHLPLARGGGGTGFLLAVNFLQVIYYLERERNGSTGRSPVLPETARFKYQSPGCLER